MAFLLPRLEFDYDALEPYFDATTMEIHYNKHHVSYLNKLNEAIENTGLGNVKLVDIFSDVSEFSSSIRNNGGGFFNHNLFWKILKPGANRINNIELADAINKYFGTLEHLKQEFAKAAANLFGSGWAWVIRKDDGQLLVTSTSNQDNPLMDIAPIRGKPLLCLDVWEHAYYLRYQNNRAKYIEAFWQLVNWDEVAKLYFE